MKAGQWQTLDTIARRMKLKREGIMAADRLTLAAPTPAALPSPDVIAKVVIGGDLSQLTTPQKVSYYRAVCESLGLNPLTKPFEFLRLSGKEVLYALRNCTDQLRHRYGISVEITAREVVDETYIVTARASFPDGRHDESIGAVPIAGLKGEARSNAMMKCETKSKRRVTLSLVGLSTLDETEIDSIPGAQPVPVSLPDVELPGPAPVEASHGVAVPEGDATAPAVLHTPPLPEAWKPLAHVPMTGSIVDVKTETAAGRRSAKSYTKATIKFWPTDAKITECVELYTLDLELGAKAIAFKESGDRVTVTVKDTERGHELQTLEVANDSAF